MKLKRLKADGCPEHFKEYCDDEGYITVVYPHPGERYHDRAYLQKQEIKWLNIHDRVNKDYWAAIDKTTAKHSKIVASYLNSLKDYKIHLSLAIHAWNNGTFAPESKNFLFKKQGEVLDLIRVFNDLIGYKA